VIQAGGRTALAEARLYGDDDRLFAHATSTVMIFRPEPVGAERAAG
jgi:acyl-coenzyme A thioesterase PaaI-like protein